MHKLAPDWQGLACVCLKGGDFFLALSQPLNVRHLQSVKLKIGSDINPEYLHFFLM